jgi:hypothetical protein
MSVIPLKADIHQRGLHVRSVPQADMVNADRLDVDQRNRELAAIALEETALVVTFKSVRSGISCAKWTTVALRFRLRAP